MKVRVRGCHILNSSDRCPELIRRLRLILMRIGSSEIVASTQAIHLTEKSQTIRELWMDPLLHAEEMVSQNTRPHRHPYIMCCVQLSNTLML